MARERVDFPGSRGARLAGRIETPEGEPAAYALFAHCFTCSKDLKSAGGICRELLARGVAVLRFDFTGLGESGGDFADTNFSSNVEDLVAAADFLRRERQAPALLVRRSLGGAAMLAAAADIAAAKAVAVIGAPADPAHVLRMLGAAVAGIEANGQAEVNIGGRPFTVTRAFVDDVRMQDLKAKVVRLGRALLVLHSPVDAVVGI
ncbi:MAG: alpha/beta fold hydrolase, partial [Acidobacteria bacterium]|nr:alpha/beta fold hydrolase [Acidobacteriota bacterium]